MDLSSFVTSLITSSVIFAILLALHAWLSRRPWNIEVYYPSRLLKRIPPPVDVGFFSWIYHAWSAPEDQVLEHAGLDAAVYLMFLKSGFWICMYTAAFCVPILLPLSGTDHYFEDSAKAEFTNFDKVAMGNIEQKSSRLWAFAIADYWLTISTLFVLWKSYKHVVFLRTRDQASSMAKPQQYAVLVRDIPARASCSMEENVDTLFRKLHPTTYQTCVVATNNVKVNRIWRNLEKCRKRLAHVEAVYDLYKVRPRHKSGVLGLHGAKVDSIDFYRYQVEVLGSLLREEQLKTRTNRQQGAAIVIFNNRAAAASAGQAMHSQFANSWTTVAAPEPREVIWANLPISFVSRIVRQFVVYFIVLLTILFYMIPIAFISAIIALKNLEKLLSFLKPITEQPLIKTVLQAFLPQIALIIFMMLLPAMLLKLSQIEGIPSKSHVVRAGAGKFFYFIVFNVFLGVTLAGTLFESLNALIKSPTSIVGLLSESLPKQATFFISFIALKFLVGYGLELSRIGRVFKYHLKKRLVCKTEEEIRDAWAPGSFEYATCVPDDMLILMITICYAVLAPAILPFTIIYFGLGWLLKRNQAMNVMVPEYESGGRMWPHLHSRILAALFLSQLTMLGYFGTKKFLFVPLIIVPPIATLVFAYLCKRFYYPSFGASPLIAVCEEVKEVPAVESIVEAYTPECLQVEDGMKRKYDPENQNQEDS